MQAEHAARVGLVQAFAQQCVATGHSDISIVYRKEPFLVALRLLLSLAAIYMALVGLGLIVAPQAFGAGAVPTDASAALLAYLRLWGSPLLGIAVLNWMARHAEPSTARNAIILGNAVESRPPSPPAATPAVAGRSSLARTAEVA